MSDPTGGGGMPKEWGEGASKLAASLDGVDSLAVGGLNFMRFAPLYPLKRSARVTPSRKIHPHKISTYTSLKNKQHCTEKPRSLTFNQSTTGNPHRYPE